MSLSRVLWLVPFGLLAVSCTDSGGELTNIGVTAETFVRERVSIEVAQPITAGSGGMVEIPQAGLSLEVPANATATDVEITAATVEEAELGNIVEGIVFDQAFEFGPDGTVFDEPLALSVALTSLNTSEPLTGVDAAIPGLVLISSDGSQESLPANLAIDLDSGRQLVSTEINHFSTFAVDTANVSPNNIDEAGAVAYGVVVEDIPTEIPAFLQFKLKLVFKIFNFARPIQLFVKINGGEEIGNETFLAGGSTSERTETPIFTITQISDFTCLKVGQQNFSLTMTPTFASGGDLPPPPKDAPSLEISKIITCTNPIDSDGDGLNDQIEIENDSDPFSVDSDDDGIEDGDEDFDNDGLSNLEELDLGLDLASTDSDENGTTDGDEDNDSDQLSNKFEFAAGSNPLVFDTDGNGVCDCEEDFDNDELSNLIEQQFGLNPLSIDSDGDGVNDAEDDEDGDGLGLATEISLGTNPNLADSDENNVNDGAEDKDQDGLSNAAEIQLGTDPTKADTDGDGIEDGAEDEDQDNLTVIQELVFGYSVELADSNFNGIADDLEDFDGDTLTNGFELLAEIGATQRESLQPGVCDCDVDIDGDGINNSLEQALSTDPKNRDTDGDGETDGEEDADGDGLTNKFEQLAGTDPNKVDSDGDGQTDGDADPDDDGLTNRQEQELGTDPLNANSEDEDLTDGEFDSDGDGLSNEFENDIGTDPTKADSDGDGVEDGDEDHDADFLTNEEEERLLNEALAPMFDFDDDGLTNEQELDLKTSPFRADTDNGGISDGQEVTNNTNPLDPSDDALSSSCTAGQGIPQTLGNGLKVLPGGSFDRVESVQFGFQHDGMQAPSLGNECSAELPTVQGVASLNEGFANLDSTVLLMSVAHDENWFLMDLLTNTQVTFNHFFEFVFYQYVLFVGAVEGSSTDLLIAGGVGKPGLFGGLFGEIKRITAGTVQSEDVFDPAFSAQSVGGTYRSTEVLVAHTKKVDKYQTATQGEQTFVTLADLGATDSDTQIVSAFQQQSTGAALVLTTHEVGSVEENLFAVSATSGITPREFSGGGLGTFDVIAPRQVRCIVPTCVVSFFGGARTDTTVNPGGVALVNWAGNADVNEGTIGAVELLGVSSAPAGVVGIDLISDQQGNTAVVAAGFTNGTLYELVVASDGTISQRQNQPVPTGCQNPGHVRYLVDAAGLKIIGTCFNSSHYFVLDSELL